MMIHKPHGFTLPQSVKVKTKKHDGYASISELLPKSSLFTAEIFMKVLIRMKYITPKDKQPVSNGGYTSYKLHRVMKEGEYYLRPYSRAIHVKKSLFDELYRKVLDFSIRHMKKELVESD